MVLPLAITIGTRASPRQQRLHRHRYTSRRQAVPPGPVPGQLPERDNLQTFVRKIYGMELKELLDHAPAECLESELDLEWHMTRAERAERFAAQHLLQRFKPETALEVGTFRCGTLQALSRYSKHVDN